METLQEQINRHMREVGHLQKLQQQCSHQWGETFSNPEKVLKEQFTGEYESHGIHHWPKTRFVETTQPRWTRCCKLCGIQQHTTQREVVPATFGKPVFG